MVPASSQQRDRLLTELARRDGGSPAAPLNDQDESTLASLKSELETLAADLCEPPPIDAYANESGCRRAIELVEQIAHNGEFTFTGSSPLSPSAPVDEPAPEAIGPYRVVARLGRGGMGAVYKAVHPKLKREVAVKVLPARRMGDPAAIVRFEREMEAVGALAHPNIVAAHDAGEVDGQHYLVMEYVDGLDLSALVRRVGPLPIAEACEIIRQAALGLDAAASRGIVHRDVKPSNLMLAAAPNDPGGVAVKILDFGLARLVSLGQLDDEAVAGDPTSTGLVMGTLRYMAPEQCIMSSAVDVRADIYSLGATLYKLLCGSSPYGEEKFNSPLALIAALGTEAPPRLTEQRADAPAELGAIVARMLARTPSERFAKPSEVVAALEPFARGADLASLLGQARGSQPSSSLAPQRSEPTAHRETGGQRSHGPLVAGLALLVLLAALLIFWPRGPAVERVPTRRGAAESLAELDPADPSFVQSRRTAEWLAARGARFGVLTERGDYVEIQSGDALPAGPLQLDAVDLNADKEIRDDDLIRFNGLPLMSLLNLSFTSVSDAGLEALGELPDLEHLFLVETLVTDDGLNSLERFPRLVTLFLRDTRVTDEGLANISRLDQLNELMLVGCDVTDDGLVHLSELSDLRDLYLNATGVTVRGVADLESALPDCTIYSDFSSDQIARARHDAGTLAE
jgi:serine/threonine protein kinase